MSIASLAEQYRRQDRWRRWDEALARLPLTPGQRVLDLGCGVGQMAARLSRLGVEVVGIDSNEELLTTARVDHPGIRFVHLDLRDLTPDRFGHVDGLWASFVAAYFPDLEPVLARWCECLRPGGCFTDGDRALCRRTLVSRRGHAVRVRHFGPIGPRAGDVLPVSWSSRHENVSERRREG